jgi:cell division septum initiation protein DivIVA
MRYTPVELRHVRIGRALLGYKRDETDRMLEDIADSFEEVWRERGELADRLEDVEKRLDELKQREGLLASPLVSAERAAVDAKDAAKREAELVVAEAHGEARSILRTAQTERERLFAESRRVETLLRAALGMVEESQAEGPASVHSSSEQPSSPPAEPWPRHEDTREFEAVSLPERPSLPEQLSEPLASPTLPPIAEGTDAEDMADDAEHGDGPRAGRDFAWG